MWRRHTAYITLWFGQAKFVATLATAAAGLPGGIFATGAGLGTALHTLFPSQPVGAVVLLGIVVYSAGLVRAPLTSVIIITETTAAAA